jgi:hypothetical protein
MSAWQIYLIGQASDVAASLFILGVVSFICSAACAAGRGDDMMDDTPKNWSRTRRAFIAGIVFISLSAVIPSSKTLAAMYVIPPIVNNEQVRQDAGEIYKLAVEFAKDKLGEKDAEK